MYSGEPCCSGTYVPVHKIFMCMYLECSHVHIFLDISRVMWPFLSQTAQGVRLLHKLQSTVANFLK